MASDDGYVEEVRPPSFVDEGRGSAHVQGMREVALADLGNAGRTLVEKENEMGNTPRIPSGKRPNIVVLLTDDQGPWAVPWKMSELQMPRLQELAERSYVFDQMHCPSPVCSPARASILTGRMPSAHGVHDWLTGTRHPHAQPDIYADEFITLGQVLGEAGYRCGLSGKWHVGDARYPAQGFEYWYAHRFGGGPYYGAPVWNEGEEAEEPDYYTYAVGHHALEFLDQYAREGCEEPFFLYMCTTAPHDPWGSDQHPDELLNLYEGEEFPSVPRLDPHPWAQARMWQFGESFADPEASLRGYCASLTGVDRILGWVLDDLEKRGLSDNTMIVYLADNGFSCGHHGIWGKGNGTFPLNFWDNSVKVPFVMYVPEQWRELLGCAPEVACGTQSPVRNLVSSARFFETICEMAGVCPPEDHVRVEGSLLEPLRGQVDDDRVVVFDEYGGGRMIRRGTWKYVVRHDGPSELYDLSTDPDELENLAENGLYGEMCSELEEELTQWFSSHETLQMRGFECPVTGLGQVKPLWRSRGKDAFVQTPDEY